MVEQGDGVIDAEIELSNGTSFDVTSSEVPFEITSSEITSSGVPVTSSEIVKVDELHLFDEGNMRKALQLAQCAYVV
jgi:hypothetical protein